uniref:WD_REPEATS_REGION domain-containing protein n=1 Tax=Caenorhabditis japonica TaxID=281687 RepID=A0A8R1HWD7_CAEJA
MSECLMFGMDCEARCMVSVAADEENVCFLVGTNNIKNDNNQVNKLYMDQEAQRLMSKSFRHPAGEVRAIAAHPSKANILATCTADFSSLGGSHSITVWNIEEDKRTLETVARHPCDSIMHCLEWESSSNRAATMTPFTPLVHLLDMHDEPQLIQKIDISREDGELFSARWSPHYDGNMLGVTVGRSAICMDTRTANEHLRVPNAHSHRAISIDFNPNLQHVIATCGDDGYVRIWDTRSPTEALMSLHPHAHWVWQVRFHPVHDQLLLTGGSDACVVLSCAQSVSSEQIEEEDDEDEVEMVEKLQDGQLERIDEHEDSVYSCAWSAADPWSFASLSYDGRMILSNVSRKHKYALMQL